MEGTAQLMQKRSEHLSFSYRAVMFALSIIGVLSVYIIGTIANQPSYFFSEHSNQYAYLADALIHGHTSLDLEVPPALAAMENPYDYEARSKLMSETGDYAMFDYAFYNGKYYCYFGVAPALLLYAPYQLFTGGAAFYCLCSDFSFKSICLFYPILRNFTN